MLNMNRPERWGLFCSLLFGGGWWGQRWMHQGTFMGSSLWPGHSPSSRGVYQLDALPSTCCQVVGPQPGPSASCRCSLGHPWNRAGAWYQGMCPVSLHPRAAGLSWQSWGWAGLRPTVGDAAMGSVAGLSLLSPSASTRKGQCTTCPLCFMANTQPDLFRIDLSFFGQLHTFLKKKYVLYNWQKQIPVLYSKAFIFLLKLF